jgi:hypothetical protein
MNEESPASRLFLRAELAREPLCANEWGLTHCRAPFPLGVLRSVQLGVSCCQNRPPHQLGGASQIPRETTVHGFNSLVVAAQEMIGHAEQYGRSGVGGIMAKRILDGG